MPQLDASWVGRTVSKATLREEDLIVAFEEVLDSAGEGYDRPASVDTLLDGNDILPQEWEEVSWYLHEELLTALCRIAPEGCYFGAHEGDGALFGFWSLDDCELPF